MEYPKHAPRPRRKTLAVAVACAAALTVGMAGCGGSDSGSSGGGGGTANVKIGLVTKTDTNPFFVKLREAAKKEADAQGASLVAVAGKFDGDNEGQVSAIENLIAQGVKGILITPSNSTGILGALKKAKDRGIVVVALDTETDPKTAVDATYATDNTDAGRKQGAWVKAALAGKPAKIAMLDGTAGGTVDTMRHVGFLEGMGVKETDPTIVGRGNTNGDQSKAQTVMEGLLQRVPDINVVYTINEPAARGGFAAIKAKGTQDKVLIGSIDGGCQGVQDVKDGKIGATVMQFPAKMASEGVKAVVAFAKDGKKPSGFVNTGSEVITDKPMAGVESKDTAWGLQNCWG
jgi:fructose transport system substrate-binding protein